MQYKVLMVAPTSFFSDNGCHVRILEEVQVLKEAGHQVTVCTYHMGNDVDGLTIKRSLDVPWKKGVQVGSSRHKIYFDAMLSLKSTIVNFREKPDIIHGHLHEGALIGWGLKLLRFGNVPLIFDFQGSMTSEMIDHHFLKPDGPYFRPALKVEKIINHFSDSIITSTFNSANILQNQFGMPPERITTITDRVNSNKFHPYNSHEEREATKKLKIELGIPLDKKIIIYLGLLAPYQGTDLLLQAASILKTEAPDTHFVIMGYPGVDNYRELATYLGLENNVTFPGRIPYHEAPRYLAIGDIAVAPKMSATEGSGKVTNYMAMGLPTVVFDTPVSRELLGDLGVYARYGDTRSLADGIKSLLDNESMRISLGTKARAKAITEMSWDQVRTQLETVYANALAQIKQPRSNRSATSSPFRPQFPDSRSKRSAPGSSVPEVEISKTN